MKKLTANHSKDLSRGSIKKKLSSKIFLGAAAAQIFLLIIILIPMVSISRNAEPLDVPLSKWSSDYVKFEKGYWYADKKLIKTDDGVDFLTGPHIPLEKGSYLVSVDYNCTAQQTVTATANNREDVFVKTGTARLNRTLHNTTFRVQVDRSVEDFEIKVNYSGNGAVKITNIEIKKDYAGIGRIFVILLAMMILGDLIYLFYEKLSENRTTVFALICIALLASVPLFCRGIGRGHDFDVHVMRIEGIAAELSRGVFPVRMSSDWIQGYGYPVSIYYGDLLLYIPALLRIAGFDVVMAYKIYTVLINIGTAVISYCCFKGIFKNTRYALLLSLVYSTASYRLTNLYIRTALGEFTAGMFLPLIALALYRMYTDDPKDKSYRKNSWILAFGMSGLICNHMLTTEMTFFVMIILCIVLIKQTIRIETIKTYLLAVGQTILLSAFFIIPFLDYYMNVNVRLNNNMQSGSYDMKQRVGVNLAELFSFYRDPFSEFTKANNPRIMVTPGTVLMLALVAALFLIIRFGIKKSGMPLILCTGFSMFILFVASRQFPWDACNTGDTKLGLMLVQVQFPWRYIGIALIFMTLAAGFVLKLCENEKFGSVETYMPIIALLCIISTASFAGNYIDDTHFTRYYNGADLNTSFVGMGEYILEDSSYKDIDGKVTVENIKKAEISDRDGCHIELDVETGGKDGSVTLPVFDYKGYNAVDENGHTLEISEGNNRQIKIAVPNSCSKITVDFVEPAIWRFSEFISLLTLLFFCFGGKAIGKIKQGK